MHHPCHPLLRRLVIAAPFLMLGLSIALGQAISQQLPPRQVLVYMLLAILGLALPAAMRHTFGIPYLFNESPNLTTLIYFSCLCCPCYVTAEPGTPQLVRTAGLFCAVFGALLLSRQAHQHFKWSRHSPR